VDRYLPCIFHNLLVHAREQTFYMFCLLLLGEPARESNDYSAILVDGTRVLVVSVLNSVGDGIHYV